MRVRGCVSKSCVCVVGTSQEVQTRKESTTKTWRVAGRERDMQPQMYSSRTFPPSPASPASFLLPLPLRSTLPSPSSTPSFPFRRGRSTTGCTATPFARRRSRRLSRPRSFFSRVVGPRRSLCGRRGGGGGAALRARAEEEAGGGDEKEDTGGRSGGAEDARVLDSEYELATPVELPVDEDEDEEDGASLAGEARRERTRRRRAAA